MRRWAPALGFIDIPNARSSHASPTARGGGVAIVLAFSAAIFFLMVRGLVDPKMAGAIIFSGGAVALVGFIDDKRPLAARVRFAVHTVAAVLAGVLIESLPESGFTAFSVLGRVAWVIFTIATLLWSVNLFNFMDGIDGIAATEAIFITSAAVILNLSLGGDAGITAAMLSMAAACLGFLFFNWPPASIFMGDVGSGFLGMALAILALCMSHATNIPLAVWPILGGVFLVDATFTLLRRMLRGDRWREAHRAHAYQHLARKLHAHRPVTLLVLAVDVVWLFPWAWYLSMHPRHEFQCLLIALTPIVAAAWWLGAGRHERS